MRCVCVMWILCWDRMSFVNLVLGVRWILCLDEMNFVNLCVGMRWILYCDEMNFVNLVLGWDESWDEMRWDEKRNKNGKEEETCVGAEDICTGVYITRYKYSHLYRVRYPIQMWLHICTGCFVPVQYPVQIRVMNGNNTHFSSSASYNHISNNRWIGEVTINWVLNTLGLTWFCSI
jgi:hypothetical protein